jgi:hypothetical protein
MKISKYILTIVLGISFVLVAVHHKNALFDIPSSASRSSPTPAASQSASKSHAVLRNQQRSADSIFSRRIDLTNAIAQLAEIDEKSLLKPAEATLKRRLLSDEVLLRSAGEALIREETADSTANVTIRAMGAEYVTDQETSVRLGLVAYLHEALQWKANPSSALVREIVMQVILSGNLDTAKTTEIQQRLAGDKVELYRYLLRSDASSAKAVKENCKGTLRALLAYADGVVSPAE